MFDVGFFELLLIGMIALLVLGPQRLPHAARMVGAFLRKARISWLSLKAEVEREIEAEEIRKHVNRDVEAVQSHLERGMADLRGDEATPSSDDPDGKPDEPR